MSTTTSRPDSQTQKANLARIRDNQRRSRARRKEYLQELETKYRACEAVGVEASSEIQTAARRVLEENRRLRALLKRQGLTDVEIDGFSSSPDLSSSNRVHPENPQFPLASNVLRDLLSAPRECKPGSCSDEPSTRKQSCVSSTPSWVPNEKTDAPSSCTPQPKSPPQILPPHSSTQHISPFNVPQPHHRSHSRSHSDNSFSEDHQVYNPQHNSYPYMYPLDGHVGDDHVLNNNNHMNAGMPRWDLPQTHLGSPHPFMSGPLPSTESYHPPDHTSTSCSIAADAIRSYSSHAGPEVEHALGCQGCRDSSQCHVSNSVVFGLMDHYDATAAAAGEGLH